MLLNRRCLNLRILCVRRVDALRRKLNLKLLSSAPICSNDNHQLHRKVLTTLVLVVQLILMKLVLARMRKTNVCAQRSVLGKTLFRELLLTQWCKSSAVRTEKRRKLHDLSRISWIERGVSRNKWSAEKIKIS